MRHSFAISTFIAAGACLIAGTAAADQLFDPMRPANSVDASVAATVAGQIRVEAIVNDGERKIAIVNGRVVREGDRVGGATVESISAGAVRFNRGGRSELISLPTSKLEVRRTATLPREPL
jgi:MSHA biogenesis protein MshK